MSSTVPDSVVRLIELFKQIPGVGPQEASRLAYLLVDAPEIAQALGQAALDLKDKIRLCSICFNITEHDPCLVCQDRARDRTILTIVKKPLDILILETIGDFNGLYHVLHGLISPREGIGPQELNVRELVKRVQTEPITELIFALRVGQQEDATAMIIQSELARNGLTHVTLKRRPGEL